MKNETKVENLSDYVRAIEHYLDDRTLFRGVADDTILALLPKVARADFMPHRESRYATERSMFKEFQRMALPHLPIVPRDDWEWLAVAQHHLLPTWLLDWTTNALAALWFAVSSRSQTQSMGAAVWILRFKDAHRAKRTKIAPVNVKKICVHDPAHVTPRVTAQGGWFTVHPNTDAETYRPITLGTCDGLEVSRLLIPKRRLVAIHAQLDLCGINHASMYPGVDGLSQHIAWVRSVLADEAKELDEEVREGRAARLTRTIRV